MHKIELTNTVPTDQWEKFFDQFSASNRGKYITIEIIDVELGEQELIQNVPLLAMIYDRPDKGNSLAIEVGKDQMTYGHSIDAPTEVLTIESSKGEIIAILIVEANGRKMVVKVSS